MRNAELVEFWGAEEIGPIDNVVGFLRQATADDTYIRRQMQNFPEFCLEKGDVRACVMALDWLCEWHRSDYLGIALEKLSKCRHQKEFSWAWATRVRLELRKHKGLGNHLGLRLHIRLASEEVEWGAEEIVGARPEAFKVISLGKLCDFVVPCLSTHSDDWRDAYDQLQA